MSKKLSNTPTTFGGHRRQAYYVNATYWKSGSDAPIFLCVGGEGVVKL